MPTLDYYGLEHEDAISGVVLERDGVLLGRDGWGGFPYDLTLCVEKDKTSMCLQVGGGGARRVRGVLRGLWAAKQRRLREAGLLVAGPGAFRSATSSPACGRSCPGSQPSALTPPPLPGGPCRTSCAWAP
jgi:hypothetical protein